MKNESFNTNYRKEYHCTSLDENKMSIDPFIELDRWWQYAIEKNVPEMNAATLATVGEDNAPHARIILIKNISHQGLDFFTNYQSAKAQELAINPQASLVFWWQKICQQIRIEGVIEKIPANESSEYFYLRPKDYQIGAWASPQSQIVPSRQSLQESYQKLQEKYKQADVPYPTHWGGYRLIPQRFEFWLGGEHRLHDRIIYELDSEKNWLRFRLAP